MGKKKSRGEYNDFTEDTRYQNSNDINDTLQSTSTLTRTVSPPSSSNKRTTHPTSKPKKPPLTHFLCLPLVTATNRTHLATALSHLRGDVQTHTPVPPTAVRPVGTLHLTLGVMSLSATQLTDAIHHLEEMDIAQLLRGITTKLVAEETQDSPCVSENAGAVANPVTNPLSVPAVAAADPEVLTVKLIGLRTMQGETRTSILYAEPREETGRLGRFAESVRMGFEERGLVQRDERGLKLHATVLNTIYAKSRGRGGRGSRKGKVGGQGGAGGDGEGDGEMGNEQDGKVGVAGVKTGAQDAKSWMRFDASTLIEVYRDFVWADDVRIDRVQICKMGAKKILHEETGEVVDEEYEVVAEKCI